MNRHSILGLAAGLLMAVPMSAQALTPKVMIIGIDGTRSDALQLANTPALDGLIAEGAVSYSTLTSKTTLSGPGWSSMLTGVWPDKHQVVDNSFEGGDFETYPHIFNYVEAVDPTLFTASIVHWTPINTQIVDAVDYALSDLSDAGVASAASDLILDGDPDILYLHFDDVDGAGHSRGFSPGSPPYIQAIEQTDEYIAEVLQALERRSTLADEDWMILVSTDHGGLFTGHGANIPVMRMIWLIQSGPSVPQGEIPGYPGVVDIGVSALHHLGIPVDPAWDLDGGALSGADGE